MIMCLELVGERLAKADAYAWILKAQSVTTVITFIVVYTTAVVGIRREDGTPRFYDIHYLPFVVFQATALVSALFSSALMNSIWIRYPFDVIDQFDKLMDVDIRLQSNYTLHNFPLMEFTMRFQGVTILEVASFLILLPMFISVAYRYVNPLMHIDLTRLKAPVAVSAETKKDK